jgi:hypothetical protein
MKFNSFEDLKQIFNWDLFSLLDETFKQSNVQSTMIEFNQDQLLEGKDSTGTELITKTAEFERSGFPYANYTVSIKKATNKPYRKVTLKQEGEFYKTFKVVIIKEGYKIIANFNKPDSSILDNFDSFYHDTILGLDNESLIELVMEVIFPRLSLLLKKQLGL